MSRANIIPGGTAPSVAGEREIALLRQAAESGDAEAQDKIRLLHQAAESRNAESQYILGKIYDYTPYSETALYANRAEALRLYEEAANQNYAPALMALGNHAGYHTAEGVEFFRRAADLGYAPAQLKLAQNYRFGTVVDKNPKEALKLFYQAAEQGYAEAQVYLGHILQDGDDDGLVAKNPKAAVEFFRQAANQGDEKGKVNLARCYCKGIGVEKDTTQAIWMFANLESIPRTARAAGIMGIGAFHLSMNLIRFSYSVDKSAKNTPLDVDQIIEVIDVLGRTPEIASKRIAQNKSTLIADLVEVSAATLSLDDLNRISERLRAVPGMDIAKNSSCKTIAGFIAKREKDTGITSSVARAATAGGVAASGRSGAASSSTARREEVRGDGAGVPLLGGESKEVYLDEISLGLGTASSYSPPSTVEVSKGAKMVGGSAKSR